MKYVLNDLQAPAGLRLREGAQVMLLANLNVTDGLVNGSRGVVTGFVSMKEAADDIARKAMLRGAAKEGESVSMSELQVFARDNPDMMFPKVLFETTNTTREVSNPSSLTSVCPFISDTFIRLLSRHIHGLCNWAGTSRFPESKYR